MRTLLALAFALGILALTGCSCREDACVPPPPLPRPIVMPAPAPVCDPCAPVPITVSSAPVAEDIFNPYGV